jgi:alkylation response protein AidB-like acyl-CoA dehydrogenase
MMGTVWKQMVELGWTAMALPEQYGGSGNAITDVAVLFEELGVGPVPGPLFSSGVLCARILLETATEAQKKALLPDIASGKRVFALAMTETSYGWTPDRIHMKAKKQGSDYVLSGTKVFVHDAVFATDLLVVAGIDGSKDLSLFRIDARAAGVAMRNLEGFITGMNEVSFKDVKVAEVIGAAGAIWEGMEKGMRAAIPVLCAYKVGGCKRVWEMSLNYAAERKQFGQVIGRFARVQEHIIQIVNAMDAARWTTYEALWRLDGGMADAATSIHVAKSVSSEAYMRACDFAHEVHAGIGVSREYGLTLHTKMSRSLFHCLGGPKVHKRKLERLLNLIPKAA